MALKYRIQSWLTDIGLKKKGTEQEQQSIPKTETPSAVHRVADDPLPDPALLILPPDHALHQLYELRKEQAGWLPPPHLRIADGGLLPDGVFSQEANRLRAALDSFASMRLGKANEKPPAPKSEDEQPPPPPQLDAVPRIFISANKLVAWLLVFPPVGGGEELNQQMLTQALAENKIAFGIDTALLEGLPEDNGKYFQLFLIAKGQPAVDGINGSVEELYPRVIEREFQVNEYDQVDYTSLNLVQNADKGDIICRITLPTEGVPGKTVTDQDISAKNGKKAQVPKGRGTELNEEGTLLLAAQAGHVEFTGRSFQIKPVLDIGGNVDYSTGNLNFLGDIHIHGDVCSGFTVRAMGNIHVDGVVEASTIEAGGDLVVAKGIQGNGQNIIRAHRNIYAKYLENLRVYVRENLQADCIVNCDIYSDGEVEVRSGRGIIMGGRIWAARKVRANVIGSRSECHTAISLGGTPCMDFERTLLLQEVQDLQTKLEKLERQPSSPTRTSLMGKTRIKLSAGRMKLEQMDKDIEKLKESTQVVGGRRLECDIAYPGTEIAIGSASVHLEHETRPCAAMLVGEEIRLI